VSWLTFPRPMWKMIFRAVGVTLSALIAKRGSSRFPFPPAGGCRLSFMNVFLSSQFPPPRQDACFYLVELRRRFVLVSRGLILCGSEGRFPPPPPPMLLFQVHPFFLVPKDALLPVDLRGLSRFVPPRFFSINDSVSPLLSHVFFYALFFVGTLWQL